MTHRVETILARVQTLLTGLATTGSNAFRGRVDPLSGDQETPAVWINMGEESIVEELSQDLLLCEQEIFADVVAAETATGVDTAILAIQEEVTVALAADITLGLAFVQKMEEVGSLAPEPASEGNRDIAGRRLAWLVTYERSRTDPAN